MSFNQSECFIFEWVNYQVLNVSMRHYASSVLCYCRVLDVTNTLIDPLLKVHSHSMQQSVDSAMDGSISTERSTNAYLCIDTVH